MNYGELREQFKELLNRDDCTDSLADRFITMGLTRIERVLRTPLQRIIQSLTVDGSFDGAIYIPTDYLGLHQIRVNGYPIPRLIADQRDRSGFYIEGSTFIFTVPLGDGDKIEVEYYNEFTANPSQIAITNYSYVLGDVVIYAALIFAADHFLDIRKADFNATFQGLVTEVQTMADLSEMSGGSMVITPYGGGIA